MGTCLVKQPQAWEISGYYPTERCVRWADERDELRVSLEGFVYRGAGSLPHDKG